MNREILITCPSEEMAKEFFKYLEDRAKLYKDQPAFMMGAGEDEREGDILHSAVFSTPKSRQGYYQIKIVDNDADNED